jgi:hypothetical protein
MQLHKKLKIENSEKNQKQFQIKSFRINSYSSIFQTEKGMVFKFLCFGAFGSRGAQLQLKCGGD